jgi:hypothetical protein
MDEKMNLSEHADVISLKSLYTSLIRPKLEYASCVWSPLYDVRVHKGERVQRRFVRNTLRDLWWTDIYDFPPYEHRCVLLRLDTLVKRRSIMFKLDILSGRINSPNFLSALDLNDIELAGFRVSSNWFPSHDLRGS